MEGKQSATQMILSLGRCYLAHFKLCAYKLASKTIERNCRGRGAGESVVCVCLYVCVFNACVLHSCLVMFVRCLVCLEMTSIHSAL